MKIRLRNQERAMATLVVVVLLGIMSLFIMANSRALSHLKREIDAVEEKQLQKFKVPVAEPQKREQDASR